MESYEVKGISQASEVKRAYETAVEQNMKFYRAVSGSGKPYGWVNGRHVLADNTNAEVIDGEFWFKNDKYIEPQTEEEILDEVVETLEETIIEEESVKEEPIKEEIDYKALYETEKGKAKELENALLETTTELTTTQDQLNMINQEFAEYKAVVEAFKKL